MVTKDNTSPIEIFSGDFWQASLIKQLLLENEIYTFTKDEFMSSIDPFILSSGGINQVTLMVSQENYELASSLVANIKDDEYKG